MNERIFAFKRGPKTARAHDDPEHRLQVAVAQYLTYALPTGYLWTASAAGMRVAMQTAVKMKAAGLKRGWPDIQILSPRGGTRYIELKSGASLSDEQKAFRRHCEASGHDIWALARSVEDVEAILLRWGIEPACEIGSANRYHAGA